MSDFERHIERPWALTSARGRSQAIVIESERPLTRPRAFLSAQERP